MAPVQVTTSRLLLLPPRLGDAPAIFARYASDPEVTRFLAWRRHATVEESRAFVEFSETQWRSHACGPYLIWSRDGETLLGSTGLQFENADRAVTGYVLARDAWGQGYATEALRRVIGVARDDGFQELDAFCHAEHRDSARVLEKCGFLAIGSAPEEEFPNSSPPRAPAVHYRLRHRARVLAKCRRPPSPRAGVTDDHLVACFQCGRKPCAQELECRPDRPGCWLLDGGSAPVQNWASQFHFESGSGEQGNDCNANCELSGSW